MNTSKAREERLAAALRQNLRRRKAQATSRDTAPAKAEPAPDSGGGEENGSGGDGGRDT